MDESALTTTNLKQIRNCQLEGVSIKKSKHQLTHKAEDKNVYEEYEEYGGCISFQQLEFSHQVSNVLGKMLSEKANADPSTYHSNPEKLQR